MDADDIAHIERIERQYDFLCSRPDIALVGVSTIAIDEAGRELSRDSRISDPGTIERCMTLTPLVSHNWLCRKEVYDALGGYRALAPVEDYDFLLRLHAGGWRFTNLPFFGMKIRYRNGNTATTNGVEQMKAFNYVTRLYRERLKAGSDSYSQHTFETAVQTSSFLRYCHARAVQCLHRAFEQRKAGRQLEVAIYGILSVLWSPHLAQVFARRRLMHIYRLIGRIADGQKTPGDAGFSRW
jgi:hypothetical protein